MKAYEWSLDNAKVTRRFRHPDDFWHVARKEKVPALNIDLHNVRRRKTVISIDIPLAELRRALRRAR